MPCLFACKDFCTVHIRAPGKLGYVLGRFAPDEAAARAILDYAVPHAASAAGRVAYADWTRGGKGHFLVRVPHPVFVAACPPLTRSRLSRPHYTPRAKIGRAAWRERVGR